MVADLQFAKELAYKIVRIK